MMTLALQMLYFEDLSVGMTETLHKTVDSANVAGLAAITGDAILNTSPPRHHSAPASPTGSIPRA